MWWGIQNINSSEQRYHISRSVEDSENSRKMYGGNMNYYVPIQQNVTCEKPKSRKSKPQYTSRILVRRFALTSTSYKYLEIGINVTRASFVELLLGDNRGNRIILPHETWTTFIERRADIEQLMEITTFPPTELMIRDLSMRLVKIRDDYIVKFTLCDNCLYMKPATVMFLFELEHCIDNEYLRLCRKTHYASEKFQQFVTILRQNGITNKYVAARFLRDVYDENSIVDCELFTCTFDNMVHTALHDK